MSEKDLQLEDTVSADRKERIIYVGPGKTRKISSITSRQNFDNEKFTRKTNKGEDDEQEEVKESAMQPTGSSQIDTGTTSQSDTISQDKPKKSNNPQIEFVTGTEKAGSASTAIGNAQNMGIKKISEAIVKKALTQVKADKNIGTEEIPFDGPYTKTPETVKDKSGATHTPMSRVRHLARQAMAKQGVKESVLDKVRSRVSGELEQHAKHRMAHADARNQAAIERERQHSRTDKIHADHTERWYAQLSKEREDDHKAHLERDKVQQAHYNKQRNKINSAFTKKVTKEEVEQIDEISLDTMKSAKDKLQDRAYDAHMDDNKSAARHYASRYLNMKSKIAQKQRKLAKEEIEQVDEKIIVDQHGNKIGGGSVGDTLKKLPPHKFTPTGSGDGKSENPIKRPYIPHVANKPTNAPAGAVTKGVKEEVEQIDELSIDALKSYIKGAKADKKSKEQDQRDAEYKNDYVYASDSAHKAAQRKQGIKTAKAKLNKEETGMSKTYAQFVEQLLEYTPGPGGVTRVQGRSYGAQYHDPEGEDDADDKPAAKADAPKRGRGRPKGATSGANHKVTTGKKNSGVDYTGFKLHLPNSK